MKFTSWGDAERNNWQVTVQADQYGTRQGGEVEVLVAPGYVQIDDVSGGNLWSKGPDALRALGVAVPDFHRLPTGRYSWAEAEFRLWLAAWRNQLEGYCNTLPSRVGYCTTAYVWRPL